MAPDPEARERAFYDHESEQPRRRRRPAADWGVGEDIFDRMPSRRFTRADRRRAEHQDHEPAPRHEDDADFSGHLMMPAPGESRTIVLGAAAPAAPALPDPPAARKTVVIKGHPDRLPVPRTQRPSRTAVERIAMSPDRIAGYAVALGFLLVLIAVLTTGQ